MHSKLVSKQVFEYLYGEKPARATEWAPPSHATACTEVQGENTCLRHVPPEVTNVEPVSVAVIISCPVSNHTGDIVSQ